MLNHSLYNALRNQLGSIRKVYWRGNKIHRKNDFTQFPETVLLLHGFFQTRNIWELMEKRLRRDGYGVLSLNLGGLLWRFNTQSIHKQAEFIAEKMEGICQKYDLNRFHIIGHSMGGLVAKHYIQSAGGERRAKSLITLGTPHHGTPTALVGVALMGAGLLSRSPFQMLPRSAMLRELNQEKFPRDIPLTSIFSRQDLICPWWASTLRPSAKNLQIENTSWTDVAGADCTFLSSCHR